MENTIIKAIKKAIERDLPFNFTETDKDLLSTWAYGLYMDGWNNAKILLINNKKIKYICKK